MPRQIITKITKLEIAHDTNEVQNQEMKTLRKIEKIAFVLFITISGTTLTACSSDENEDYLEKTEGHTKSENKIISPDFVTHKIRIL